MVTSLEFFFGIFFQKECAIYTNVRITITCQMHFYLRNLFKLRVHVRQDNVIQSKVGFYVKIT